MSFLAFPSEADEVDFTIEHEVWNVYELSDGSTLRIRPIVLKFLRMKQDSGGARGFGVAAQNVMTVRAKREMMGSPSSPVDLSHVPETEKIEVKPNPIVEEWNHYKLADGSKVGVKLVMISVWRLKNRYDQLGYPVYLVKSDNIVTS